jgi:NAD(P)-dependent dehydrogenase (short-subunit alcohol dehydrogenase family)
VVEEGDMERQGLLAGKVAVITGAGSGVGRASALTFAREGAAVICADLRAPWVEDTVALVEQTGGTARAVTCDVTNENDVVRALGEATQSFGRLDVVFNNAGISTPGLSVGDHDQVQYDRIMDVNMRGVFHGCKHAVAAFTSQGGGGSIINTSSVSGLVGFGGAVYGITKGGVNQLTKALAVEVGPLRIRVNAVCPGPMLTNLTRSVDDAFTEPTAEEEARYAAMNPMPVTVGPDDVADAALFLASDLSRTITGVLLPVDAGFVAR